MNVKRWVVLLAVAAGLITVASGCGIRERVLASNQPTATVTRTPRPTFTPRPEFTDTAVPTDTPAATDTPEPTDTPVPPTKAPAKPTAKPKPTQPPVAVQPTAIPPTPVPQPTAFPYAYKFYSNKCEHSGGTYVKVVTYADANDPNSLQAGVKVRLSWAVDGPSIADVLTNEFGEATFVLAPDGAPAKKGTYYAWIIDSKGNRISDMSAPIVINGKGEDAPDTCWLDHTFFAHQ